MNDTNLPELSDSEKNKDDYSLKGVPDLVIPYEIARMKGLSRAAKHLWAEIYSLRGRHGLGCWASNAHLAEFLDIEIRQLQNLLAELKRHELLVVYKHIDGRTYRKALRPGDDFKNFAGVQKIARYAKCSRAKNCTPTCNKLHPPPSTHITPEITQEIEDTESKSAPVDPVHFSPPISTPRKRSPQKLQDWRTDAHEFVVDPDPATPGSPGVRMLPKQKESALRIHGREVCELAWKMMAAENDSWAEAQPEMLLRHTDAGRLQRYGYRKAKEEIEKSKRKPFGIKNIHVTTKTSREDYDRMYQEQLNRMSPKERQEFEDELKRNREGVTI